jgi:hypothetical protein
VLHTKVVHQWWRKTIVVVRACVCVGQVGMFLHNGGAGGEAPELVQTGILRTNCIDCLDRTNVAQFCFGR